jgi:hypothetical protein
MAIVTATRSIKIKRACACLHANREAHSLDGLSDICAPDRGPIRKHPMPHYYFHIRDGAKLTVDEEGRDFPDITAARKEIMAGMREMIAENLRLGAPVYGQQFEIADESGTIVDVVELKDIIPGRFGMMPARPQNPANTSGTQARPEIDKTPHEPEAAQNGQAPRASIKRG